MINRLVAACLMLLGFASATALSQTVQPIPEPNEVVESQPAPPAPEPVVVAPAVLPAGRFGGDDGVFRFVVVGDALARGLGAGLERLTDLDPRFEVVNRFNEASGLARPQVYDWPAAIPKILKASTFDAVVVLLGTNDRQPIRVGDTRLEFGTPEWTLAYKGRLDALLANIKANGARTYWVTLPPMQNAEFESQMKIIAGLQRERVVTAGEVLVDVGPPLSNPDGSFMIGDLDAKGKARRIRAKDGIGFSRQGNDVLASLVMSAIRRVEAVPELQSSKDEAAPAEQQVALAVPAATSPLFGQEGVDGIELSFEAEVLAKEAPQQIAPDLSNAGKLGLRIARNSLAQRFYRSGEALGVPYGRFDDFSMGGTAP